MSLRSVSLLTLLLTLGAGCAAAPARREPPRPLADVSVPPETVMDTEHYVTLPPVGQAKTVTRDRFTMIVPATYEVEERDGYVRVQNYTNPSDAPGGLRDGQFYMEISTGDEDATDALVSLRETYGDFAQVDLGDVDAYVKKGRDVMGDGDPGDLYLVPLTAGHATVNISSRSDSGLSLATLLMLKIDWKG